jgi:predicted Zn-dependent protease
VTALRATATPGPRLLGAALLLALAPLAGAQGTAPARKGAPGPIAAATRPAPGSDESELWYAMDRAEISLRQSPYLVRDPALNDYVHGVLCKVTAGYCDDLRVYIVDVPYFNASMAPNGVLLLWTGALLRVRNEAQLALVLGHEFGHYRERHTLQQWRRLKKNSTFLSVFGMAAAGAGVGYAGMAANIASLAGMMKFSRDKEREADRIGFAQLDAQGYDLQAGAALWDAMLREEDARDYDKPIPVFSSHPKTRERRDDLAAAAAAHAPNPRAVLGTAAYQAATRPFHAHWLDNELSRRMFSSSVQAIGDLRHDAPADELGLYTFYLGEAYLRRAKGDDRATAARLFAEAITQPGAPPAAWREHGLALRDAGDRAAAAAALHRYLQAAPDADDVAFVRRDLADLEGTR